MPGASAWRKNIICESANAADAPEKNKAKLNHNKNRKANAYLFVLHPMIHMDLIL